MIQAEAAQQTQVPVEDPASKEALLEKMRQFDLKL
jgi:hypothetical protein